MRLRLAALAVIAVALVAQPALAYNETLHAALARHAFTSPERAAWLAQPLQPPTEADLAGLRGLFWKTAAAAPDAGLRAKFLERFPTEAALDAWAFKELFMLNPAARVHGFDLTPDEAGPLTRGDLLQRASRWPDDDKRNQDRFARDGNREVLHAPDGSPLPFDPATLDLGALEGSSSQGHAHYGLVKGPLSDDPEVLKKDPAHFAVPPTAHAVGPELAQLYTDLALLAATSGLPSSEWLAATFAGAAFHHIEDVANQIHTVQVGIYDFFEAAFLQSKLRDVKTLGGLLGERKTLKQLGLRLIANHHLFSEDLFAKRFAEAEGGKNTAKAVSSALASLGQDDAECAAHAAEVIALEDGQFGRGLADAIIDFSSKEGPEVYKLAYQLTAPTLRDGTGHAFDGALGDDADNFLQQGPKTFPLLEQFYALELRGLRRATTGLRLWQQRFEAESAGDVAALRARGVQRSFAFLLRYQDEAAKRRAASVPPTSEHEGIAWGYPIAAAILLAAAAFGLARLRRKLLRRAL